MINIYLIIIIAISLFATIHNRILRPKDVTGKVNDKHDKISNELRNYNPSDNLYHDYVILYFEDCTGITSVNLSRCTTIGDYALNECSNLTSVTFGSNITTIGEAAFNDCGAATTFYFYSSPHTVTYGNPNAFQNGAKAIWDDGAGQVYIYKWNRSANGGNGGWDPF